jgi:hypothetical protein
MNDAQTNLDLVTTEELIAEIQRRCEASVIAFAPKHDEQIQSGERFSGHRLMVPGLIADLVDYVRVDSQLEIERNQAKEEDA